MKDFLRQNGILLLVIALLLSVLIGISSAFLGGQADPLSNMINVVVTPIRSGIASAADWMEGVYTYVFHYGELEAEITELRAQVAGLEEQVRQGEEASRENEQLRELLAANGWTWATAGSVLLFSLFHWPCSTTCLTIRKETGSWTLSLNLSRSPPGPPPTGSPHSP